MRSNLAVIARGAQSPTREGLRGRTDRAPQGWVGDWAGALRDRVQDVRHPVPTTPGPCRPLRARFAGTGHLLEQLDPGRWAPGITHPVYPPGPTLAIPARHHPGPPHVTAARVHREYGTTGTCTYDRFEGPVGEPRGMEHTPVSGSQGLNTLYLRFTRPFDWV